MSYYSLSELLQKMITASGVSFSDAQLTQMEAALTSTGAQSYGTVFQNISTMSVSGTGDLVLYSGTLVDFPAVGTNTYVYQQVSNFASAIGGYTLNDTEVGTYLNASSALSDAADDLIANGGSDAMANILSNTAFAYASQNLVENATGNVDTFLGDIVNPNSIFAQVEANAIVTNIEGNDGITSLNLNPASSIDTTSLIDSDGNANLSAFKSSGVMLSSDINDAYLNGTLTAENYAQARDATLALYGNQDLGISSSDSTPSIDQNSGSQFFNDTQLGIQPDISEGTSAAEPAAGDIVYTPMAPLCQMDLYHSILLVRRQLVLVLQIQVQAVPARRAQIPVVVRPIAAHQAMAAQKGILPLAQVALMKRLQR